MKSRKPPPPKPFEAIAVLLTRLVVAVEAIAKPKPQPDKHQTRSLTMVAIVKDNSDPGDNMAIITQFDSDTQHIDCAITPKTASGKVGRIDGVPVWTVSDSALGAFVAAADGLSGQYIPTPSTVGNQHIECIVDADMRPDHEETLTAILDIAQSSSVLDEKTVTVDLSATVVQNA